MPRSRTIKPGFFVNEDLIEIEPVGRLLFIGLWTIADREGRLEDRPKRIKVQVLPGDNCDVDATLDQLQASGFLYRYIVEDIPYIQVCNWDRHQHPHPREEPSAIPPYDEKAGPRPDPETHSKTIKAGPRPDPETPNLSMHGGSGPSNTSSTSNTSHSLETPSPDADAGSGEKNETEKQREPSLELTQVLDHHRVENDRRRNYIPKGAQLDYCEKSLAELGVERVLESVTYMAVQGKPELIKAFRAAFTHRQQQQEKNGRADNGRIHANGRASGATESVERANRFAVFDQFDGRTHPPIAAKPQADP